MVGFCTAAYTKRDSHAADIDFSKSPLIQETLRLNPNFHYYIRVGGKAYGNNEKPKFYYKNNFDKLIVAEAAFISSGICSHLSKPSKEGEALSYIDYTNCGAPYYIEFYGLEKPIHIENKEADTFQLYTKMLTSTNFFTTLLSMFSIFLVVLLINVFMISRVARLARSFNPENLDYELPEDGLPVEVVPLVRAVNSMIASVDELQTKQRFFLSAAAHEMRTPLTVLRTRMEILDESPLKDKLVGDLRKLTTLVNQLLFLMSVGSRRELSGTADLVAIARQAADDFSTIANDKGVTVLFKTDITSLVVPGEEALIRSSIGNLIENAISFGTSGSQVKVHVAPDGLITVTDSGPGIPPEKLKSVFEPFFTFPPNRKGSGLGLAIVKAVAEMHGGEVTVSNVETGGARLTLRLFEV